MVVYPYKCLGCERGFTSKALRDAHERSCDQWDKKWGKQARKK